MKNTYIKPKTEALNILNIEPLCASQQMTTGGDVTDVTFGGEATTDIGGDTKGESFWE